MKVVRILLLPFALATVGAVRFLAPWKLIRFGPLWSGRLGHLIGNTECYLGERDALYQHPFAYDIWYHTGVPASPTIARKYRKVLHIWLRLFAELVVLVNRLFLGWEKHMVQSAQVDRDIHNLGERFSPHIEFTAREERKGRRLLRKLGIPEGEKWVCLIVRDSAYLKVKAPNQDFSYHDYRDSDISDYAPAAIELARRGYYVLRMGTIVGKPFLIKHTKIIDYALHKLNSDFGQFYLGANCAFCLGTSTGFMSIPQMFNRPVGIVNYVPIEYTPTWLEGLVIWKHHLKDGKKMTIKEIVEAGVSATTFGPVFEKAGVTLEDNSAQEIYDVAVEMAERDNGGNSLNQDDFWKEFPRSIVNGKPLHGRIDIRVGREFFKKMIGAKDDKTEDMHPQRLARGLGPASLPH